MVERMIHVKQTETYTAKDRRGNCYAACIASVFEVPLDSLPDMQGRQDADLMDWLAINFPGVMVRTRDYVPFDPEEDREQLGRIAPPGLWIANVESPRFTEECRFHVSETGEPMPPFWYDRADCPHCHGSGERQGFHAIVCKSNQVVHDPYPKIGGYGWGYNGRLCGVTWFEVTDPARLIPRRVPG